MLLEDQWRVVGYVDIEILNASITTWKKELIIVAW